MNYLTLDTVAQFTWGWDEEFFMETNDGNFVFSDAEYGGTGTIRRFNGYYADWLKGKNVTYGRDKGRQTVRQFCGANVRFVG